MYKKKLLAIAMVMLFTMTACITGKTTEVDCIGSITMNEDYELQIIANRSRIKDKEVFAWELFEMCVENKFHSIVFSYDIEGYPQSITMDVYLWEKEMAEESPEMVIEFMPMDEDGEYNIKDNPNGYVLYIDGKCYGHK